jgi:mono/diheme cytochrome c family protein
MALLFLLGGVACGGAADDGANGSNGATGGDAEAELTAFQVEHGIGPITEIVELGDLDPEMAEAGEAVFTTKCSACHKLAERYVGPPLGDATTQRSATYIMNMILNPKEMYERHPEAKALLAEYLSFMPDQNVTPEEARAVVEYLRTAADGSD